MAPARFPDYSDFDISFIPHPTTGDIVMKTGEDSIKQSVKNLIFTNFYDRKFRSHIGSNTWKLLFDNPSTLTAGFIIDAIKEVLRNYEPRIKLTGVAVILNNDQDGFDVTLKYTILNTSKPVQIELFLQRIR